MFTRQIAVLIGLMLLTFAWTVAEESRARKARLKKPLLTKAQYDELYLEAIDKKHQEARRSFTVPMITRMDQRVFGAGNRLASE